MSMIQFNKNITTREMLPTAGKYGIGLDFPAEVELMKFEWASANKPAYAKDDDSRNFALFVVKVIFEGKTIFINHHEPIDAGSGSGVYDLLMGIGVQVGESTDASGEPVYEFDPETVAPRKLLGLEVGDPVKSKKSGGMFTGNLKGVKLIGMA